MPIDMASVYAARFENNPDVLRAVLLTGRSPDPKLNAFTALRALQLQAEAARAKQAQMAQRPTQSPSLVEQVVTQPVPQMPQGAPQAAPQPAPQSGGLAAMPAGSQGFAPGGIVSFANGGMGEDEMPSIEAPSAGGGGEEDASNPLLEAVEAMEGSPGSPVTYQQLSSLYPGLIRQIMAQAPKGMTAAERAQFVKDYIRERQIEAGPSPFKAVREEITTARGERAKNLDRGLGVALLKASRAALQPGGTARGLAAAASEFGDMYGQVLQADRAERRSLANMEMNIADAERKERMGMYGEARAAASAADKDRVEASRAHTAKMTTLANLVRGGMQATKPTTGRPPSQPKLAEQLGAAEIAFEKDPSEENARTVAALRRAVQQTKTTDIGGTRAGLGEATIQERIDSKVSTELENWKYGPGAREYRKLLRTKPEAAQALLDQQEAILRKRYTPPNVPAPGTATPAPKARAARPAPPEGFVED